MHCKTLRSEYMKRFKDPHREAHRNCYEEMLKYRLARRLLEHAHNPWMWDGWDGSSGSSSGHSTPPPKPCETGTAAPKAEAAPANQDTLQAPHDEEQESGHEQLGQEKNQTCGKNTEKSGSRSIHSALTKQNARKLDSSPPKMSLTKEIRHPFALYASGERKKDTGSQKTHNVCAPTQENEIHESALRAKNRRQKDKRKQMLQKQRARSADAERVLRRKPSPADNPWMTEYMRCYSARAR